MLRGFEETDILAFGGTLETLRSTPGIVRLTFVPPFPIYPARDLLDALPKTDIPGLVLNAAGKSRVAYLPADIDRRYARDNLPDHADLLANIVRWAAAAASRSR